MEKELTYRIEKSCMYETKYSFERLSGFAGQKMPTMRRPFHRSQVVCVQKKLPCRSPDASKEHKHVFHGLWSAGERSCSQASTSLMVPHGK
eukprot:3054031-Amphidinium_carterae.1